MSVKLNVLIPDGDSTWAMPVIHCLSRIQDYRIFVLSNKKRTASKYSKYTTYYKFYDRSSDTSWIEVINTEVQSHGIDVIVPIAEREILFFIENSAKFVKPANVIPLPELSAFRTALNKNLLSEYCEIHRLPHPKSVFREVNHMDEIAKAKISFPILIKPLDQKGGDGILKVDSVQKFDKYIQSVNGALFVQEFIEGYDIDCSVLCKNGNILCYTIQRGNLKGHNNFAPQLGFDLFDNPDVLEVVKKLMSTLNWTGIAHLDLRYNEKTEQYFIIEINPRFWGSISASLNSGVNFPHLSIQLALQNTIETTKFIPGKYMRLKGVIKTIQHRPDIIFKRKFLLNHTEVKLFLEDPMPTGYRFIEWLIRKFK